MKFKRELLVIAFGFFVFACGTKEHHAEGETSENDEWPEMDAFHMTMAEAFHPLKDSGNVEPATRLMNQLADEADKWVEVPLPEKVNTDEMKARLQKLKTDLRTVADEVNRGAPEDQVGTTFYIIHDQFHEIMEAWHAGGKKHEHEEKRLQRILIE